MMSRRPTRDQASSCLFLTLGLLICLYSLRYKIGTLAAPGSGFMPLVTGGLMCLLSLAGLTHATLASEGHWQRPASRGRSRRNSLLTLGALVGFLGLMTVIGFVPATVLFIGFLLRAIVPQPWPVVIAGALAASGMSYLVFDVWLQAQLPKGLWGG